MLKTKTELSTTIIEARKKKGISQRELSRIVNMDCAELSRIEAGKRLKPNILYLKGLADALDLSLVELMTMSGYSEVDINWGRNITEKRSNIDYENCIKDYERFYFDVLEDIDNRRKNTFACKGIISDIIDRIETPQKSGNEVTMDEILEKLKEVSALMRPNLEKFDTTKHPKYLTSNKLT